MKCFIFGAGPIESLEFIRAELPSDPYILIAADGGLRHTTALGLVPDVIIGDMDSVQEEDVPTGAILYPSRKDDTDMMLAVKKGLALGAREFYLFGGMGGRFDHTYANIQTLAYLTEYNAHGWLMDENHRICILQDDAMTLSPDYRYLSVFAYGGSCSGVTITGAGYNLENAVLTPSFPLGVSNYHAPGETMRVSVQNGSLLIIQTKLK
ncbi:MAG: thiamine diphosphokinase [Candidatus Merdivicinus sp.]